MSDKCRVGEFVTKEMKISMDWNSVRAKLASGTDVQGRLAAVKHLESMCPLFLATCVVGTIFVVIVWRSCCTNIRVAGLFKSHDGHVTKCQRNKCHLRLTTGLFLGSMRREVWWNTIHSVMMTSSNGNIQVPRYWPFVREIHRSRWITHIKASDAELWCILWSAPE